MASSKKSVKKPILLGILALCVVAFIVIPKPQHLVYKRAKVVSEGLYWDGFGKSGVLLDANASFVRYDTDTDHLHICYNTGGDKDVCQQYTVIENKGLFSAVIYLINNL